MVEPTFLWVDIDLIVPNPWNPNAMDDDMFVKAIESIHQFGFVDPVTCREVGDLFQIIDGEHRHRAAADHSAACRKVKDKYVEHVGMRQLPITNLGAVSDPVAQKLTIVLNETRGEAEPKRLGELLTTLLISEPLPKLVELLPLDEDRIIELAELPKVNWEDLTPKAKGPAKREERWVERVFRLPVKAAEALDRALNEAKAAGAGSDWEALQRIAEEYGS